MNELGRIDDELAELALQHGQDTGYVRSMKDYFKTLRAVLFEQVLEESKSAKEAEIRAEALLHIDEDWKKYLVVVKRLGEADKRFEYLDTRRSIGQSLLKQMQRDADEAQGGGRGQHGVGES